MKFRLALLGLLVLVFVVAACGPPPNLRNEKFLHDNSLFTNEPCAAPCWNNITPGETDWDDALVAIQDSPDFDEPQTQAAQDDSQAVGALWKETDGDDCCQMVSENGEKVDLILLQLAPDHTLGELIESHGEPGYVVGTPGNEDQAIVNLFYPDKSLIVIAFVAGAATGELSESSEIIGAYYLTPERMQLILDTSSLYPWKGYEAFTSYAPDVEDADYAITPSVTLTPTPGQ